MAGDDEDEDEDEEPNYWLDPDAAAALDAASLATPETLLIIGGGPAGLSASIYAARAGLKPLIVAPAFGGQLLGKGVDVENYPGVSGASATGRGVVGLMRAQAASFDTRMVNDAVIGVDLPPTGAVGPQRVFTVRVNGTRTDGQDAPPAPYAIRARAVVVATGADSRWLGVPGEHDFRGKGVSSCATCDGFLYREKTVVVIGVRTPHPYAAHMGNTRTRTWCRDPVSTVPLSFFTTIPSLGLPVEVCVCVCVFWGGLAVLSVVAWAVPTKR